MLRNVHFTVKFKQTIKKKSSTYINKNIFENVSFLFKSRSTIYTSLTLVAGYSGYRALNVSSAHVYCNQTNLKESTNPTFDWNRFLELVWPDIWIFAGAVLVSFILVSIAIDDTIIFTSFLVSGNFTNV